ncbi:hypothetical protein AVEN_23139-1 [Araneus ventricosus]|uniref:Uncharacterized protein n=1 Tax=Araneus ventricosus TaxID=182803 RepID=A0A4Y2T2Y6_ARAVE|nr:hypothetical protein AVEN_23139-1 [Araneus ventricosus]
MRKLCTKFRQIGPSHSEVMLEQTYIHMLSFIKRVPTKVPYHPIDYRMAAAIFKRLVSRQLVLGQWHNQELAGKASLASVLKLFMAPCLGNALPPSWQGRLSGQFSAGNRPGYSGPLAHTVRRGSQSRSTALRALHYLDRSVNINREMK